jgi:ATP-dependent Clp protease ATP-binding subunit ClpA
VFERYTERARHVVVLAQEEARLLGHGHIGTEHILLGLLREEEGLAGRLLASVGVTIDPVREEVVRISGSGERAAGGQIPFTPDAKKALERSLREALSLGHDYIGTEHILLGVSRQEQGLAVRILLDLDVDGQRIRDELMRMLDGPEGAALRSASGEISRRARDMDRSWLDFTPSEAFELAQRLTPMSSKITFEVRPHGEQEPTFRVGCRLRGSDTDLRDLVALEADGIRAVLDRDGDVRLGHLRRPPAPEPGD